MDETHAQPEPTKAVQHAQDSPPLLNAEWLASLSHELRGPLTAIQGYASMVLRHEDRLSTEERREFLQAIKQGSDRIASLLDRFLDIANLEAGTIQLHLHPIDMVQLVQESILTKQQECPAHSLSLTLKQEHAATFPFDQRPFVIQADGSLLRKMLLRLLDNAQKYSPENTPIEVTLSCSSLKQSVTHIPPQIDAQFQGPQQRFVELSIRDQGIGIPSTAHERIFERFERVDMQLSREVTGLGLGLTLCKYIVALHHGAIWVESTPGEGSTFRVLFPVEYKHL